MKTSIFKQGVEGVRLLSVQVLLRWY